MRALALLCVLAFLVSAALVANAQPSNGKLNQEILAQPGQDITFYGATFAMGRGSPMPMNTAFPWGVSDFSFGTPDGGCGTPPPLPDGTVQSTGAQDDCIDDFTTNELWWYTTAGFIQARSYDEVCGSGTGENNCDYTNFHNERGQTKDIYFDTSQPAHGILHMSADNHGWLGNFGPLGLGWNWDPGYYPDWTAAATIYHANLGEWSKDPSQKPDLHPIYDHEEGVTQVAYGIADPFDMWSLDPTIPVPMAGQTVWPIPVELEWDPAFVDAGGVIPFENDLIVRWEWYQLTDDQVYITGTPVTGYVWNLNGGEDYPNQITFPVRNPIDVELVFPRFVHDKLVILSVLNTPWGSYDVDLDSIQVTVRDAAGTEVTPDEDLFQELVDVSVAHNGHYNPINLTYIWDYKEQGLKPGDYTITVEVDNFQGSAHASTTASFTIAADGSGKGATAGQSGILTLGGDFEEVTGGENGSTASNNAGSTTESKGSPGPGIAWLGPAMVAAVGVARRRLAPPPVQ